ncbi:hypothetical protein VTK73DRAFT_8302 [Phialemonium thermophilum]|uniref:Uncharacterized protein n=1 Tax=Phialemonium thermophilum TaxID=223376 RepID=A0ABR3W9B0_9PEZI
MVAWTYTTWLHSLPFCCIPLISPRRDEKSYQETEKTTSASAWGGQPEVVPPPSAEPLWTEDLASGVRRGSRERLESKGKFFAGRNRFLSSASSRRPRISAPTDFRHVYSESFQYPIPPYRPRPPPFHPLELNLYSNSDRLSPILPHFGYGSHSNSEYEDSGTGTDSVPLPAAAASRTPPSWDDSSVTLTHERSQSSMSFHLPRRALQDQPSFASSGVDSTPTRAPPRSRPRAYTSPSVERIVERIASAMIEKERLQAEIDSIIERQSIINSRPSTAYGVQDLEPMPSIPALPAAAPSFAERFSTEGVRPRTAPCQPTQNGTSAAATPPPAAATTAHHREPARQVSPGPPGRRNRPLKQVTDDLDRPLAPPLPLVLRPPLRKKKSFSRVSSWLFPGSTAEGDGGDSLQHRRGEESVGSITNLPRPITGREGFYQCVSPAAEHTSVDTVSSQSTWESSEDEGEDEGLTLPTATWSPGGSDLSGAGPDMLNNKARFQPAERAAAFLGLGADSPAAHRPQSVGVAF